MSITQDIGSQLEASGFPHYGFARLERPHTIDLYRAWIEEGCHGEMSYLARHLPLKEDPRLLNSQANSAIVVTKDYVTSATSDFPFSNSIGVARYARQPDYHWTLRRDLEAICVRLKEKYPEHTFLPFVDSAPVMERDLAVRAGLGWIGKNTCLIEREKGSLFWIAQILTSLELEVAKLEYHDHCGTCRRCIEACPTGALTERKLDARKCISYWTIESKAEAPSEIQARSGAWLFGCDICQMVCPWNIKTHGRETMRGLLPQDSRENLHRDLTWLLESSTREIERALQATPLLRRGVWALRRNAMLIAASQNFTELIPLISKYQDHVRLRDVTLRVLAQLAPPEGPDFPSVRDPGLDFLLPF